MTYCDSSTPLSSRFDAQVLRPDSAIFDKLFDTAGLIEQGNPLDKVDRQSVINVTNRLNDLLSDMNLDAYPVLKKRFGQFPITYVEVADFALADNTDLDKTYSDMQAFDPSGAGRTPTSDTAVGDSGPGGTGGTSVGETGPVDGTATNVGTTTTATTTDADGTTTTTAINADGTTTTTAINADGTKTTTKTDTDGTTTSNTTDSNGTRTTVTTDTSGNTTTTTVDRSGNTTIAKGFTILAGIIAIGSIPVSILNFLSNFDFHLDTNIGVSIGGGLCGQFGNIFDKLFGLFTFVKSGKDRISDIGNPNEKDLVKKGLSITFGLTIKELHKNIVKIIKKLVNQIKKIVKSMIDFAVTIASKIYKKIKKMAESILNFFSDINLSLFFKRIETFVASTASQFERLTLENLGLLMFRFCQFSDTMHGLLMAPAKSLSALANTVATETTIAQNTSLRQTKEAVTAGGVRIPPADREKAKTKAIANNNAPIPTSIPNPTNTVFDPQIDWQTPRVSTLAENAAINTLNEDGIKDKFSFSPSVKSDTNNWQKVSSDVWIRLLRISEQTGTKYVVNSGFRDKAHNAAVGGSSDSIHMSGFAIDISVSSAHREEFFLAAARAGFTGIGIYSTFIHLDLGARRMWVAGNASESKSKYALTGADKNKWVNAIPKHNRDEYRKNSGATAEQLARQNSFEAKRAAAAEAATMSKKRLA